MVVPAQWQAIPRVARALLRVAHEMSGVQPLTDQAVAERALATVTLDDLHLESLLIGAPSRLAKYRLSILKQTEWFIVNGVSSGHSHRKRAKLDEEDLLAIIPGCNPPLPDAPPTSLSATVAGLLGSVRRPPTPRYGTRPLQPAPPCTRLLIVPTPPLPLNLLSSFRAAQNARLISCSTAHQPDPHEMRGAGRRGRALRNRAAEEDFDRESFALLLTGRRPGGMIRWCARRPRKCDGYRR